MASGATGNGTQASLEDMLSTDVDESVVNALKGSLESQLCDDPAQAAPGSAQFQQQQQQQQPQQQQPQPQQQQAPQPLPPQQQQQTTIVAPAQHFQVATSTAITTSAGAVITTAQQMQTVSAVPVTAGGPQQMSAMHNLANVASQQSPIVVQKNQVNRIIGSHVESIRRLEIGPITDVNSISNRVLGAAWYVTTRCPLSFQRISLHRECSIRKSRSTECSAFGVPSLNECWD